MAHSNAVYEPSMEEIVASIRRIIENNDQDIDVSDSVNTKSQELRENADERDYISKDSKNSSNLFSEKGYLLGDSNTDNTKEVLSLSDVAARVRSEVQNNNFYGRQPASADASKIDMKPFSDDLVEHNKVNDTSLGDFIPSDSDLLATRADGSLADNIGLSNNRNDKEENMLISPDTDNRVSYSFDQLVKALRESDSHSLDQISADLLRPMLREWLDDNLPSMVEKLIREEIARIARGSTRR
ncbi:PopZ family protein [Candidatus Liberibacter americanus]|uniref:DUF2497 domain-containing protein n=1 Tax=Candidatus Liberibacter americanus str. Sao Paulo TaxID=1261131 RepID=U6B5A7_9HYPH|nr:DUF2497 domain-containing protein [Candidatus Liberibacter americanus]AHA27783.1 hypothetical protein lam_420 [Candidatus Liberibacter americanus str. Sao Paulo]EMS36168.1 hypothetical protein G653_02946 [Candidatus Liberibacter americanus PW_SP]